jgi:hypothetical protein
VFQCTASGADIDEDDEHDAATLLPTVKAAIGEHKIMTALPLS